MKTDFTRKSKHAKTLEENIDENLHDRTAGMAQQIRCCGFISHTQAHIAKFKLMF